MREHRGRIAAAPKWDEMRNERLQFVGKNNNNPRNHRGNSDVSSKLLPDVARAADLLPSIQAPFSGLPQSRWPDLVRPRHFAAPVFPSGAFAYLLPYNTHLRGTPGSQDVACVSQMILSMGLSLHSEMLLDCHSQKHAVQLLCIGTPYTHRY